MLLQGTMVALMEKKVKVKWEKVAIATLIALCPGSHHHPCHCHLLSSIVYSEPETEEEGCVCVCVCGRTYYYRHPGQTKQSTEF